MIISEAEEIVNIDLVDQEGVTFVTCPIKEGAPNPVERALDSSRYFVLRIEHPQTKRVAFIGIGFVDRGEAFDFQSTVMDARDKMKVEKNIAQNKVDWGPDVDFKMKDGETIKIGLPGGGDTSVDDDSGSADILASGEIIGPPPSASTGRRRRRRGGNGKKKSQDSTGNFGLDSLIGAPTSDNGGASAAPSSGGGGDVDWTMF